MRDTELKELNAKLNDEKESRNELAQAIHDIAIIHPKKTTEFEKRRLIHDLVMEELQRCGEFFRTSDDEGFFFQNSERRVSGLASSAFKNYLKCLSGLSETESYFRFIHDTLQAFVATEAPRAEVHTLAHFDVTTKCHFVSDGSSGVWWREPGDTWQLGHNGQDRVYFRTDPEAQSFYPDLTIDDNDKSLDWFWNQFSFDHEQSLNAEDSKQLMNIWLLQQLFPELRRTRATPAFLGPQGSCKTTGMRLIGRLLVGPSFDVCGVQEEKESDFVAAITNRAVVGFDNADSSVKWLADHLARYATGQRYQLRKLYSNNEEISFPSRAVVMLTSRDPHFNRPDVAERLLPLSFKQPTEYGDEIEIFDELMSRRNCIWGELLARAARLVDSLDLSYHPRVQFRMADYATFGLRVLGKEEQDAWERLLGKLSGSQAAFATEGDSITSVLATLLERENNIIGPMTTGQLFKQLEPIAKNENLWFPETAGGFGKMLQSMQTMLAKELDAKITISPRGAGGKRSITIRARLFKAA